MEEKDFIVKEKDRDERLDKYLFGALKELSRSYIQNLIEDGLVTVEGERHKASYRVSPGERVKVFIPPPREMSLEPEPIELNILYEDKDIIVLNKDWDMVVHPAPGNYSGTLVNALLYHCDDLSGIGGVQRPGIVHRLDRDTSGVMVVAKNDKSHKELKRQFKEREVQKKYLAVAYGHLPHKKGKIVAPIGRDPHNRKKMAVVKNGREAISIFEVKEELPGYSLVEVEIKTGRTHQIRVHLAYLKHPVVGDDKYSTKKNPPGVRRQLLHAWKLAFNHPSTGKRMEVEAPLPPDMESFINKLREGI